MLFEFSDGWVEACFHMRKGERSFADLCRSIEARDVCSCYEYLEIHPRAALDRDKVNCEPARGCPRFCRVAPTYELLLPMTKA